MQDIQYIRKQFTLGEAKLPSINKLFFIRNVLDKTVAISYDDKIYRVRRDNKLYIRDI
jgi:hypothetical protein